MTVLATDAFGGSGNLDANWTTIATQLNPQQVGGFVQDETIGTTPSMACYTGITWPDNQYAQHTLVQANGAGQKYQGVLLRCLTSEVTQYRVQANGTAASAPVFIYRVNAGVATQLQTLTGVNVTPGRVLKGSVVTDGANAIIKLYINDVLIISATDVTPLLSGSPGIMMYATAGALTECRGDDWEGGSVDDTTITGLGRAMRTMTGPLVGQSFR